MGDTLVRDTRSTVTRDIIPGLSVKISNCVKISELDWILYVIIPECILCVGVALSSAGLG